MILVGGTLAAMAVVAATVGLVPAIEAASGQGVAGTFVAGNKPCLMYHRGCGWSGTFRARGGDTVQHVTYEGTLPAGAGGGSSVPAIYPSGGSHMVYPPRGTHVWITDVVLMVIVGGVVGCLLWIMPFGLGRREPAGAVV
jgi:hypothetical protein